MEEINTATSNPPVKSPLNLGGSCVSRLYPEVEQSPFKEIFHNIPKVKPVDVHIKFGKMASRGYTCVKNRNLQPPQQLFVSKENHEQLASLIKDIAQHRKIELERLAAIERARLDEVEKDCLSELQPYLSDRVTLDLINNAVASEKYKEPALIYVFKAVCKDKFFSALKMSEIKSGVVFQVDVKIKDTKFKVTSEPFTLSYLYHDVMSGNLEKLAKIRDTARQQMQNKYDSVYDELSNDCPDWLTLEEIVQWVVKNCVQVPEMTLYEMRLALTKKHIKNLTPDEKNENGIIFKNKANTILGVNFVVDISGLPLTIESQMHPEFLFKGIAGKWEKTTLKDAVEKSFEGYIAFCKKSIEDFVVRMKKSKYYNTVLESLDEATAAAALLDAFDYQMKRFSEHNKLDKALVYASLGRSLKFNVDTQLLINQARKCREALPEHLYDFYPIARSIKRKITFISGPTNSGKTHKALEILKAKSGVYLGPLRLLALEVRDRLFDDGYPTSLVTGELVEIVDGAQFTASTIEMLNFNHRIEVAVIDEVHMLGDNQRGSAWLQAVLGAPAEEVIILGAPEALGAVKFLAAYLGEDLEVINLERLTPYSVDNKATSIEDVEPCSAIVVFSRKEALGLAAELRNKHKKKVSIVYGALSPAVRKEQARKFREGETDVLVATDAIGMGLNLPIKSIYFSASEKFNGSSFGDIPHDLVWQIAGRAGRFGLHETGTVGAINGSVLTFIKNNLSRRPSPVPEKFHFEPTMPIVNAISQFIKTDKLAKILLFFRHSLKLSDQGVFNSYVDDDRVTIAEHIDSHALSIETKVRLLHTPVPMNKNIPDSSFITCLYRIASGVPAEISEFSRFFVTINKNLENSEHAVKVLTMYAWLHYRFPVLFPHVEIALKEIDKLDSHIITLLTNSHHRKCTGCGGKLPWDYQHNICQNCYNNSRNNYHNQNYDDYGGFNFSRRGY